MVVTTQASFWHNENRSDLTTKPHAGHMAYLISKQHSGWPSYEQEYEFFFMTLGQERIPQDNYLQLVVHNPLLCISGITFPAGAVLIQFFQMLLLL